ncbi:hypothetical protein [Natronorubrum texcoconense]|uniref:Uncharacterized protein n=1 Tax=Natronorubrum texcoconense TaxID=1095776 RepID=A0A1G9DD14_9EURY|nr:hypothetical protein [Natronorubrum texcoconense]SDK61781.1 hypothetical protein SAMN04515672_3530 [Natronorubrum texcoconense]
MSKAVDVTQRCTFPSSIDVTAVLERLEIQFLDVNDRRAIVIFQGGILNLESQNGTLTDLDSAEITVYDLPADNKRERGAEGQAAIELIEDFRAELSTIWNSA